MEPTHLPTPIPHPITWIGIDNGVTGAIAFLRSSGEHNILPVPTKQIGRDRFIDATALAGLIRAEPHPHVIYEQGQKQPRWGCKGNYANGFHHAVVDTILEMLESVPYKGVNPKTWQGHVFKDMRGAAKALARDGETKACAIDFCRRMFPTLSLHSGRKTSTPNNNFADALCMAWYARNIVFRPEFL